MDANIINYFLNQGPAWVLFIWLFVWVMKKNSERETRLHDTLDTFASKYDIVIDELRDIKDKIKG